MYKYLELSDIPETSPVVGMAQYYFGLPVYESGNLENSPIPLWADFNPIDVRKVLPWIVVIQRLDASPEGHLIKLEGQKVIEASGVNSMGKSLAEAFDAEMAELKWREMEMVAKERCVSYTVSPVPRSNKAFINIYRGCFPFCDDTGEVCKVVIIVAPVDDRIR